MADCFPCDGTYLTPEDVLKKGIVCSNGNVAFNVTVDEITPFECTNILLNSGFEQWVAGEGGDILLNWNNYGGEKESETIHADLYSLLFHGGSAQQYFTPTTGCLKLSLWYNEAVGSHTLFGIGRVNDKLETEYLQSDNSWSTTPYDFKLHGTNGDWLNFTLTFQTNANIQHLIWIGNFTTNYVYFDDVQICSNCE